MKALTLAMWAPGTTTTPRISLGSATRPGQETGMDDNTLAKVLGMVDQVALELWLGHVKMWWSGGTKEMRSKKKIKKVFIDSQIWQVFEPFIFHME